MEVSIENSGGAQGIAEAMRAAGAESTPESTTPASQSPVTQGAESAPAAQAQTTPEVAPIAGAAPVVPPAYTPSYKFKVKDKELEFDEEVRAGIKTPEQEKKFRELYEKAYGIDEVKAHREEIRQKFSQYREQAEPFMNDYRKATGLYEKGRQALESGNGPLGVQYLGAAFKQIGISHDVLQHYMHNYFQLKDLPQNEQLQYNQRWQVEQENERLRYQAQTAQEQAEQVSYQVRQLEVKQILTRQDIHPVAKAYDEKFGQGAFEQAIWDAGKLRYFTGKQDVPAEVIAGDLAKQYSWLANQAQSPTAPTQAGGAPRTLPVIPTASGGSVSPVAKMPESTEDLQKIYEQRYLR